MTTHTCELPFYVHLGDTHRCTCGRWYAVVRFIDHELGESWLGWDTLERRHRGGHRQQAPGAAALRLTRGRGEVSRRSGCAAQRVGSG
jgi:hypothetical protein